MPTVKDISATQALKLDAARTTVKQLGFVRPVGVLEGPEAWCPTFGLVNPSDSNYCYINSVVQALVPISSLMQFFALCSSDGGGGPAAGGATFSGSSSVVITALQSLYKSAFQSTRQPKSVDEVGSTTYPVLKLPESLLTRLSHTGDQGDSGEVFYALLNAIDEELPVKKTNSVFSKQLLYYKQLRGQLSLKGAASPTDCVVDSKSVDAFPESLSSVDSTSKTCDSVSKAFDSSSRTCDTSKSEASLHIDSCFGQGTACTDDGIMMRLFRGFSRFDVEQSVDGTVNSIACKDSFVCLHLTSYALLDSPAHAGSASLHGPISFPGSSVSPKSQLDHVLLTDLISKDSEASKVQCFPPVLAIQIDRQRMQGRSLFTDKTKVRFEQQLVLSDTASGGSLQYDLISVIVRSGSLAASGHYSAIRRATVDSQVAWLRFDDAKVSYISMCDPESTNNGDPSVLPSVSTLFDCEATVSMLFYVRRACFISFLPAASPIM